MKKITLELLNSFDPCYNPEDIGFTKDLELTPLEFIDQFKDKVKEKQDVLWVLNRDEFINDRDKRLFAVWCAREALKLIDKPDERSINACNVAERFAKGEATKKELGAAWDAAWSAARDAAAWSAAWAAARVAGRDAAWDAAWSAAREAAREAAWDKQIEHLKTYFK